MISINENQDIRILLWSEKIACTLVYTYGILRDGITIHGQGQFWTGDWLASGLLNLPFMDNDQLTYFTIYDSSSGWPGFHMSAKIFLTNRGTANKAPIRLLTEGTFAYYQPLEYPPTNSNYDYTINNGLEWNNSGGPAQYPTDLLFNDSFQQRIIAGYATLQTDITAGDRQFCLQMVSDAGVVTWEAYSNLIIPTSSYAQLSFGINLYIPGVSITNDFMQIPDFWQDGRMFLRGIIVNGVAGDAMNWIVNYQSKPGAFIWP